MDRKQKIKYFKSRLTKYIMLRHLMVELDLNGYFTLLFEEVVQNIIELKEMILEIHKEQQEELLTQINEQDGN